MSERARRRPQRTTEWLKQFGLVPRADFAAMLGVSEKTLQNRPKDQLPGEVVRIGNATFYKADAVREFLDRHTVRTGA